MPGEMTLSLMGLYNWDDTIFNLLEIPEDLDDDVLITNLLAETAELEVLYPNPTVMKTLIGVWSQKQCPIWEKLLSTTEYEYNPIENYNRYENETITTDNDKTGGETHAGSDGVTESGSSAVTGKVAAFNLGSNLTDEEGLAPQSKDSGTNSRTGTTTYGHRITSTESLDGETERETHIHGNIGVMSTQDMINQEREVIKLNLYDVIIREFIERFCIMVY